MQVSNVSFGKVYQVVGDKKNMKEFRSLVAKEQQTSGNKAFVYNAQKFLGRNGVTVDSLNGKGVYFVLTGHDYKEEIINGEKSSIFYLVGATDKTIHLGNNVKRDSREILNSINANV